MISLYNSELLHVLPDNLKKDPKIQAFCYALDKQVKKLLDYTKKIEIWSNLENVDESLLDYLAVELRTQYYDPSLSVDVKRKLVSKTLLWYQKAGTVAALEELMKTVFGEGKVEEWYQYGGQPHHFRITTENSTTVDANAAIFLNMLDSIKRKTAKLDSINVVSAGYLKLKVGIVSREVTIEKYRKGI